MKIGFVIINYNDFETTASLLDTIKQYSIIDKIVVVDNASTDDSLIRLDAYKNSHIDIVANDSNKGYGSGINLGSKYLVSIIGECKIIISNSDIVISDEEDIRQLIKEFPADAGIVAPTIKEHHGESRGWKVPSPMQDVLLNIVGIHRMLRPRILLYSNDFYHEVLTQVEVVSGCFFVIDSKRLEDAGYYDENVFLYYEENIMARKLERIGCKTYVNTKVSVFHNHSVSIDKSISRLKKYRVLKQSQYYFHKKYNSAGIVSRTLLKVSEKFSYFVIKSVNILREK